MPIVYRCRNCGKILVYFETEVIPAVRGYTTKTKALVVAGQKMNINYGIPTPSELVTILGGRCPYCGKPLNTNIDPFRDIVIEVVGYGGSS